MPGDNCAVFGCGSCRRTKGIGIWKLPAAKDEAHKKWRDDWLSEITKTRDHEFRISTMNFEKGSKTTKCLPVKNTST